MTLIAVQDWTMKTPACRRCGHYKSEHYAKSAYAGCRMCDLTRQAATRCPGYKPPPAHMYFGATAITP